MTWWDKSDTLPLWPFFSKPVTSVQSWEKLHRHSNKSTTPESFSKIPPNCQGHQKQEHSDCHSQKELKETRLHVIWYIRLDSVTEKGH